MRPTNVLPVALGILLCVAAACAASAQTFTTLASFNAKESPLGAFPNGSLVQGLDGNLYGTTDEGGLCTWACGTVFNITPSGVVTSLYSFCSQNTCPNMPLAGLMMATSGNFYGTTLDPSGQCGSKCGTIFEITPGGALTIIHTFASNEGWNVTAPLIQAANGNFYGTGIQGGVSNQGTIFETTPSGTLTDVYSFCSQPNCADGEEPVGGLVQAPSGSFYGTTVGGGMNSTSCFDPTCGTVFRVNENGELKTLYKFCAQAGCADGASPFGGLVQAGNGTFYGTTFLGGNNDSSCGSVAYSTTCGVIFEMTAAGALTTLYRFCAQAGCPDGGNPDGTLIQGTDGNFYGYTRLGGPAGSSCFNFCGSLFRITPEGILTTLYSFCAETNCADGWAPNGSLVQATDGDFYGTTQRGGGCKEIREGCGTVFKLSMGLAPFVKTLPASGQVGAQVEILGTNLTGATRVTFHGTSATFTVVSSTEITTTIPAGATGGTVKVTTPSGTLLSNVPFRVTRSRLPGGVL
jgi:uncharacterized repeat protein (TIGR03803 family)